MSALVCPGLGRFGVAAACLNRQDVGTRRRLVAWSSALRTAMTRAWRIPLAATRSGRYVAQVESPPLDTSRAAYEVQASVWRRLGGARRLSMALAMSDDVRSVTAAGIRHRHPSYTPAEVSLALRRQLLGDALFALAYPSEPLLKP